MSRDYSLLVASHLLRVPSFASEFGPPVLRLMEREPGLLLFEDFFIQDVVLHGLRYFKDRGRLLPPQALKADASVLGRNGASADNYDEVVDLAFGIEVSTLEDSRDHVRDRMVTELQTKALLSLDVPSMASGSGLERLWRALDEVKTIGAARHGGARRLDQGLQETLWDPPRGRPTGLPFDRDLSGGGICEGETLLLFGYTNIGKSILLHSIVRSMVRAGSLVLLWTFETGQKQTEMRLLKGLLGWDDRRIRQSPRDAYKAYMETLGALPLYVRHDAPHSVEKSQMLVQLDRVEQEAQRKVDVLAVDYSEKRARGRDWNQVCDAYEELREICGSRRMAGIDVAQENSSGGISYFNLLKDADIGVHLTILSPEEWIRKQRSQKPDDAVPVTIPTRGVVYARVHRAREGEGGGVYRLWVDRSTGTVESRPMNPEVDG